MIDQIQAVQTLAQSPTPYADNERKQHMKQAWKAYRGKFQAPLKIKGGEADDNVLSNRCAPIVDKGVSFLFGQVVKIEAPDESASDDEDEAQPVSGKKPAKPQISPIQQFINGLWGDDDDKMTLLSNIATNGAVCGQAFVKIIPPQGYMKYPRIVVLDPLLVRIVTAPDDCSLILAYVIEYPGTADLQKRQIIARVDPDGLASVIGEFDLNDYWTITNYVSKGQSGSWMQAGTPDVWPYPFPPIFSCQNMPAPNESWGMPDLTPDIIELNNVLNFVQSNTGRILKFHAHPKTYATGVVATQISVAVDDTICLPDKDAKLNNLEMHSDLASSLNFAATIRADMDEQSRVPAVALGRTAEVPKGNVSGVALQLLFQPLIEKTMHKQRLYGRLIREITRAALVIAGFIDVMDFEYYPIELHWQDLLPIDDTAAVQAAIGKQTLGVSQATLMQELGYNPDDEMVKVAKEAARKAPLQIPAPVQPVPEDEQAQAA